ncbi:hypothetical protein BH23CHL5_BH23CHL5_17500 [soil metagenome]
MDKNRFDDLARAMAEGASRRTVLKGLTGGLLAGAAATVLPVGRLVAAQTTGGLLGDECDFEVEGACQSPYTCFEALCDIPRGCVGEGLPCVDVFPCCEDEGTTCIDGICAVPMVDDAGGEVAETLPSTGIGSTASASSSWFGAVAAGGALAAVATVLRRQERTNQ